MRFLAKTLKLRWIYPGSSSEKVYTVADDDQVSTGTYFITWEWPVQNLEKLVFYFKSNFGKNPFDPSDKVKFDLIRVMVYVENFPGGFQKDLVKEFYLDRTVTDATIELFPSIKICWNEDYCQKGKFKVFLNGNLLFELNGGEEKTPTGVNTNYFVIGKNELRITPSDEYPDDVRNYTQEFTSDKSKLELQLGPPPDTTPPGPPKDLQATPSGWTNNNSFQISWTNPDDPSGIAKAYYKFNSPPTSNNDYDGTTNSSSPLSVQVTLQGGQRFYLWLEDGVGNKDYRNNAYTWLYYDGSAPGVPEIYYSNVGHDWENKKDLTFAWHEPNDSGGSGIGGYWLAFDHHPNEGEAYGTPDTSIGFIVGSHVGEGEHTLYLCATDKAGNLSNPTKYNIKIDITNPSITITSPTSKSTYQTTSSSITIGGNCTDFLSGLDKVYVKNTTNGSDGWDYSVSGNSDTFSVSGIQLVLGENHIEATAYDNAGNTSKDTITVIREEVGVTITIDTSPSELKVEVDDREYTSPQSFNNWDEGSPHKIYAPSPQYKYCCTKYIYSHWSDGGGQEHWITVPSSNTTYTAYFDTYYKLTTGVNPSGSGKVYKSPDSTDGWYKSGTLVTLTAQENEGYKFDHWSGYVPSGHERDNPLKDVPMDRAREIIANFVMPDFEFSPPPSPSSQEIEPGETAIYTINLTFKDGFNSSVTLSANISPEPKEGSIIPSFDPDTISSSGSSQLTLTTSSDVTPGTYTIEITGNGGGKSHKTSVTLSIKGLIALWHFDEGQGEEVIDSSGNGNDGTLEGGVEWTNEVAPKNGGSWALNFDGGKVEIPDAENQTGMNSLTIEAWIYIEEEPLTGHNVILRKWGGGGSYDDSYLFDVTGDRKLHFWISDGHSPDKYVISDDTIPLNEWIHVAGVYDRGMIKVFINGEEKGSATYSDVKIQDTNVPIIIGGGIAGKDIKNFHGIIDEVKIYNIARSATQIAEDANIEWSKRPDPPEPITPGNSIEKEWFKSSPIPITWQYSDPDDDPQKGIMIEYSSDGGNNWNLITSQLNYSDTTYNWLNPPENAHLKLRVRTYDGVYWSEWGESEYEFGYDKTPPATTHILEGTAGDNGWYTSSVTITLNATDNSGGSGVSKSYIRVRPNAYQEYTGPYVINDEGEFIVDYYSDDVAGNNETPKQIIIIIDKTPPDISNARVIIEGGADSTYDTTLNFTWTGFQDNVSDIAGYYYSFENNEETENGNWTEDTSGELKNTPEGNVTVYVWAKDNAGNISKAVSDSITVIGPLHHFVVDLPPQATAGVEFNATITAKDSHGNTTKKVTGSTNLSVDEGNISPETISESEFKDDGVWQEKITLDKAGERTITVSNGSATGEDTITINPAGAHHFSVSGISSPITAGESSDVIVEVYDEFGNLVSDYTGTIHFTSSDSQAELPADYTFTTADNGSHIFHDGVILKTAGEHWISVTDKNNPSITGKQENIIVNPAQAYQISKVSGDGQSGKVTTALSEPFKVKVTDEFGNPVEGVEVNWTITDAPEGATGQSLSNLTSNTNSQGLAESTLTLGTKVGEYKVKSTSTGLNGSPVSFTAIATYAELDHFVFDNIPSPQTAKKPFSVIITAKDAYGNTVSDFNALVNLSDLTGTISPSSVNFENGEWRREVTINEAMKNDKITASDGNGHSGESNLFDVVYANASISGTITYAGRQIGIIYVRVFDKPDFSGDPIKEISISNPGDYSVNDLPAGTYYIYAYQDSNDNGIKDITEAWGYYGEPSPVNLQGEDIAGRNFEIKDTDTDNDELPDWWEMKFFGNLEPKPEDDPDEDGLDNREEYETGTNPKNWDTDGDGLPDGWEVQYGLDPNDSTGDNGAFGDPDNDGFSNLCEYFAKSNPQDDFSLPSKPESTGNVKISGRQILVNGEPFLIKGVGYQPTPIGEYPWSCDIYSNPQIYNRDLPLLREMGCNVIRTWDRVTSYEFLDACWNNGENPIYLIMGFWINAKEQGGKQRDITDSSYRIEIIESFKNYVSQFKDHPSVLMWLPGGEMNYQCESNGIDKKFWYTLLNELSFAAYQIEGNSYHPVTTDNGEIAEIGDDLLNTNDESLPGLDVWGATIYRGNTFGTLFTEYEAKSAKPFWIAEFGCDAYDHINSQEYQDVQAEYVGNLWDEIDANTGVCCGGAVFEYSDEWWKNMDINNPFVHNPGPYERPDQLDGWSDEEYYGLFSIQDNGDSPDTLTPRKVYYTLWKKWKTLEEGDINGDSEVDISDVILCLRMAIGLDPVNPALADINNDKTVDISDVILVLRKAIGLD